MISIDESVRTFLECVSIDSSQKSEEEREKIKEITRKAVVDLCFAIIPDPEGLVDSGGIFDLGTDEKRALVKAFMLGQRKALFGVITGVIKLKEFTETKVVEKQPDISDLITKVDNLDKRLQLLIKERNTMLPTRKLKK